MQKALRSSVVILMGCVIAMSSMGCATTGTTAKDQGFLNGYYQNLQPGPKDGVKERWMKPGVDFSRYNKVMLDSVVFYFAKDSEDKGIDPQEMKELADAFNLEAVNALKDAYPIVAEPGEDVLRVRVAITDLERSKPVLSAVTTVIPVGLGISIVKKGVTGAWSGSGDIGMEVMALDSRTNEVIAAGLDKRSAGFTERFTSYGSAKDAFKFWAGRLRILLDEAHGKK